MKAILKWYKIYTPLQTFNFRMAKEHRENKYKGKPNSNTKIDHKKKEKRKGNKQKKTITSKN